MGTTLDDIPLELPTDLGFVGQKPPHVISFESACQAGPVSTLQANKSPEVRTPVLLNHGLVLALTAGNVETAKYLLVSGAPISRETARHVLSAPAQAQIPLFELLAQNGWTPNTPGFYGHVLLPDVRVVTNLPLLSWFLNHGANPNLGTQRNNEDRFGGPDKDSCAALEAAAARGTPAAVNMLLSAGAKSSNGAPLYCAAGVCEPGENPNAKLVTPQKEFDVGRIPVMAMLVEHGVDVNQPLNSRYQEPQYAIASAVKAGAVERVRWLLQHGADPHAGRGGSGSAVDLLRGASDEMKRVVEEEISRSQASGNTPRNPS